MNTLTECVKNGQATRNHGYDIYLPPSCTIGSQVWKSILFYPRALADHTAYAVMMSNLSDQGILVIVPSFERIR